MQYLIMDGQSVNYFGQEFLYGAALTAAGIAYIREKIKKNAKKKNSSK